MFQSSFVQTSDSMTFLTGGTIETQVFWHNIILKYIYFCIEFNYILTLFTYRVELKNFKHNKNLITFENSNR